MSRRITFVLRGRPGLGHVIPGYALAQELVSLGHEVRIITYSNGGKFLASSGWSNLKELRVDAVYEDWPGLHLYDHGLRRIIPDVESFHTDVLVLGGEYLLASIVSVLRIPCGMLYNPEIMEDVPRNRIPSALFCSLFKDLDFLIPLRSFDERRMLPNFAALRERNWPPGPFLIHSSNSTDGLADCRGLVILIANGGGIDFPRAADSYASQEIDTTRWVDETRLMTRASVEGALTAIRPEDRIFVFSCLGDAWNNELEREFAYTSAVQVCSPSIDYYSTLERADVLISRAGAGFIADVENSNADVVLWWLGEHEEQKANAVGLCQKRARARICSSPAELKTSVAEAVRQARLHNRSDIKGPELKGNTNSVARLLAHCKRNV